MIIQTANIPLTFDITNIDNFLGLWSVMPDRMCQLLSSLQFYNFSHHLQAFQQRQQQEGDTGAYSVLPGGIARIDLNGMLTKRGSSFSPQSSTVMARRAVRNATNDPNIGGILLVVESPGGTVQGTKDLADDVYMARQQKPVLTFFEDTGGSAAYFIGSQGTEVYANESAVVGSIGTLLTLVDSSEALSKAGIKVHVLSTGPFKGAGTPGAPITKQQLGMFQGVIDQGNELFIDSVARGRGMAIEQARALATGEIFLASSAVANGLIDGVARLEDATERLRSMIGGNTMLTGATATLPSFNGTQQGNPAQLQQLQPQQHGNPTHFPQTQQLSPAQAAVQQLQQACPGAPPEFILQQLSIGASPTSAQAAYIGYQQQQLADLQQQVQNLQQPAPQVQQFVAPTPQQPVLQSAPTDQFFLGGPIGNDPIIGAAQPQQYGDAISQWEMQIEKNKSLGMNQRDATLQADRDNPGLRQQMLAERQQLSMMAR